MEDRDWSKLGWAVVWLGWSALLFIDVFQEKNELESRKSSFAIAKGSVTDAWGGGDDSHEVEYEFKVKGVRYTGTSYIRGDIGESIDIRFDPSDPSNSVAEEFDGLFHERTGTAFFLFVIGMFVGALGYSQQTNNSLADDKKGSFTPTPFYRFYIVVLSMTSATMLYMARDPHPYIFFQLLRWLVTGTAIMLCYYSYQWQFSWAPLR